MILQQALLLLAGESLYTRQIPDSGAAFFIGAENDGKHDVSIPLQEAINKLKTEKGFGTLFIPEGKYLISKTIYVPNAIRIIGYGNKRPEFILGNNSPGFNGEDIKYMLWFTGSLVTDESHVNDANAGTFYSGISNIDFRIGDQNPKAVCIRAHVAQHGVFSHLTFNIGKGYAGMHEVGNEIEDVDFIGGQYGISSGRTSPGWPMIMNDTRFCNQKRAAVVSRNTGFAIVNMSVKNTPVGVELENGIPDRLYLENCSFDNISDCGIRISGDEGACNQVNLVDIHCRNVPVFADLKSRNEIISVKDKSYSVENFIFGLVSEEMGDNSEYGLKYDIKAEKFDGNIIRTIPQIPDSKLWVSVADYGAVGNDGKDDTEAIQKAIDENQVVFVPEGWYEISKTIKLRKGSRIIGLHPYATQFILKEGTPEFSGFGSPVPMVESSEGGDDIFCGIGICTGANNNRAVGVKWKAGEKSYLNDIKFVGGHGQIVRPGIDNHIYRQEKKYSTASDPVAAKGLDLAWDSQYWSLWITDGGGGTIKNIWSANSYATAGLYASNTVTPARLFAISIEHHVREEARMNNVSNWKIYGLQFEEESREGKDCISLTMDNCHNMMFANTWFYRVIRVNTPRDFGISVSGCSDIVFRNMRAWTQVLFLTAATAYDLNKGISIWPNDFAFACITGKEKSEAKHADVRKIYDGFEFACGAASDSKGNIYFCENRLKKVYKYDVEKEELHLIADFPWKPLSVCVDTEDRPIVICRVDPQAFFMVDGKQEAFEELPDANPWYCGWGNGGWRAMAYAIDVDNDVMIPLELVKSSEISGVERYVYPAHRWRENFNETLKTQPEMSFISPDGKTVIPQSYDLNRSVQLIQAAPGEIIWQAWEDYKKTYCYTVGEDGTLKDASFVCNRGEYGLATDSLNQLYLAEGQIFILDSKGKEVKRINIPERPLSIALGGRDSKTLFITTNKSLYSVRL